MKYFVIISTILIALTVIKSLIRVCRTRKYLLGTKETLGNAKNEKINVIIPVYKEVNHIKESVAYFKELSDVCDVYYVTTSKEIDEATYNEVVKEIFEQGATNIFVDNCPNIVGTMATQLNYMAKQLDDKRIIGIYNIDSFPKKETFNFVLNNIKEGVVFQQVSYFDDKDKGVLASAQNWQNRWSLIYEMEKYLKKSGGNNFVYTIGHGFFIKSEDLTKYGYWSDQEINEDNEMGYRLVCNGVQIKPIPYMEKAEFAASLKIYIKQQSTWINGPLYAFSYFKKQKNKSLSSFWLACLNFKAAVSWLLFPLFSLSVIASSLFVSHIFTAIVLMLMYVYLRLFNHLSRKILFDLGYVDSMNTRTSFVSDYIFFICHCFGPFKTIWKLICGKNTIANKYKTEK